jgi:acyl-ACP thioesterase
MMQPFITNLRVRHYEMDALGHVNNAIYSEFWVNLLRCLTPANELRAIDIKSLQD